MKKTLLLVVLTAFVSVMANAQVTKGTLEESHPFCFFVPCNGDIVCGEVFVTHTFWNNTDGLTIKHNAKIEGVLFGDHGEYTFEQFVHHKNLGVPNLVGADYGYRIITTHLKLNGVPIAVMHNMFHFTINANGEMTVNFRNVVVNCH